MAKIGTTELVIVLVIVILVFGVGRISKLGRELGQGIAALRDGLAANEDEQENT